jgi:hypothetical protein
MHRVPNCGSALQAYALQYVIERMGLQVELIDYIYPNAYHKQVAAKRNKTVRGNMVIRFISKLYSQVNGCFIISLFQPFYKKFYKLSERKYTSQEEIFANPPKYDYYVSGSDQIWNPMYVGQDTSFMLSFVREGKRIAYSSSIAKKEIPTEYCKPYTDCLKKFDAIAVREELSCKLVRKLTGKDVRFVLDPSLLLPAKQWENVIRTADVNVDGRYILVYILGYSFDVYDYAAKVINHLQRNTGMKITVLIYSRANRKKLNEYKAVNKVTPANFLSLIKNAGIVVTDSFHATAMSLNFGRPLYSLIKNKISSDNRVFSLLQSLGAEDRAISRDESLDKLPPLEMDYSQINIRLTTKRTESINYLKLNLEI